MLVLQRFRNLTLCFCLLKVVVAFFTNGKYEIFPVLTTATANEIVEAPEISFHKDMMGMGNPGVFLKDSNSEDGKQPTDLLQYLSHLEKTLLV